MSNGSNTPHPPRTRSDVTTDSAKAVDMGTQVEVLVSPVGCRPLVRSRQGASQKVNDLSGRVDRRHVCCTCKSVLCFAFATEFVDSDGDFFFFFSSDRKGGEGAGRMQYNLIFCWYSEI